MIPRLAALVFLFSTLCVNAQDPVGYFIQQEGDTVWMYPSHSPLWIAVGVGTETASYYKQGKKNATQIHHRKIKEMHFDGRKWTNMPIASLGMDRLHEVHLESGRYLLTSYEDTFLYLYVLDKTTNEFAVRKEKHSIWEKDDRELLNTVVKKYFPDCAEGIAAVEKGIDYSYRKDVYETERRNQGWQRLFREAKNIQCP